MLNKLKVYNKPEDLAICFVVDLLSRLFPFKVVRTGTLTPVECISGQTEISGNLGQISACRLFLLHVLREVHSVSWSAHCDWLHVSYHNRKLVVCSTSILFYGTLLPPTVR